MQLGKLLIGMTTSTLVLSSVSFSLTGCGVKDTPPNPSPEPEVTETVEEYIYNRTFTIMGLAVNKMGTVAATWGTAWIISDSSPGLITDNKYYIVTNWHVKAGMDELQDESKYTNFRYCYADASLADGSDGIIDYSKYVTFNDCNPVDVTNFLYRESNQNEQVYVGIDLAVYDVNFGISYPTPALKAKFDYLRSIKQQGKKITEFVKSDDETVLTQNKFIGGYPVKNNDPKRIVGGKWECRGLNPIDFNYCERFDNVEKHLIADEPLYGGKRVVDNSAQYITDCDYGTDWMTGGASGSMVITEDLKLCGIYWGGQVDDADNPSWFKPRFSLFKTTNDDFLKQWEEK